MVVRVGERHVPENERNLQLNACWEARELAMHTIRICTNENIFLPIYKEALTDKLINMSISIYLNVWSANNVRVTGSNEWSRRHTLQQQALMSCESMLALIGLSRQVFHLRNKKVNYWSKLLINTENSIRKWERSDVKRFSKFE